MNKHIFKKSNVACLKSFSIENKHKFYQKREGREKEKERERERERVKKKRNSIVSYDLR